MRTVVLPLMLIMLTVPSVLGAKDKSHIDALTPESINQAQWPAREVSEKLRPAVLKAQVLLDRAGFSPGLIDAHGGENFAKALRAFQEANGLESTGKLDEPTWIKLTEIFRGEAVRAYTVPTADIEGPFVKRIPTDFREASKLHRLAYRSPRELLAEKFHTSEGLLSALNSEKRFDRADIQIIVPNVEPLDASSTGWDAHRERTGTVGSGGSVTVREVGRVEVDKPRRAVRVVDRQGGLIAFYPASIGSDDKPAPSGAFEVRSIARNPTYSVQSEIRVQRSKGEQAGRDFARPRASELSQ